MLKIPTKSMHYLPVWEIGSTNNTTRSSWLSQGRLSHAWYPSQRAMKTLYKLSAVQASLGNPSKDRQRFVDANVLISAPD